MAQRTGQLASGRQLLNSTASPNARKSIAPRISCRKPSPDHLQSAGCHLLSRSWLACPNVFVILPIRLSLVGALCVSLLPSVGHNRFAPVAAIKGLASKLARPLSVSRSLRSPVTSPHNFRGYILSFGSPFLKGQPGSSTLVNELRCPFRKGRSFGTETKCNRQPCGGRGWPTSRRKDHD